MADEHNLPLPPLPSMINDKDEDAYNYSNQSQETKLATVKMLLESIGQTVTVAFPLRSPINELITHFSKELRMPANVLQITFNGKNKILSYFDCFCFY
jgi:hypothetical protein